MKTAEKTADETKTDSPAGCRDEVENVGRALHGRAARLRAQAGAVQDLLRPAYLRRAAELELEAWATLVAGCTQTPALLPARVH